MTLRELLSLLRGSILNDRTSRVAGSDDYLWTDETLCTYINEAQRRFAVQGLVLRDGTTDEVTKLTLVAGQAIYPLHESVIAVVSAKRASVDTDLVRVGHSALNSYTAPSEGWPPQTVSSSGMPQAYSVDEGFSDQDSDSFSQVLLRLYPVPGADQSGEVIRLRVVRKPLDKLVATQLSATPEIPEDHHIEMLDYAAYLALRIVDDDAGNVKRAADFKATFEENVRMARALAMRKMFSPTGPQFGMAGWSWSS